MADSRFSISSSLLSVAKCAVSAINYSLFDFFPIIRILFWCIYVIIHNRLVKYISPPAVFILCKCFADGNSFRDNSVTVPILDVLPQRRSIVGVVLGGVPQVNGGTLYGAVSVDAGSGLTQTALAQRFCIPYRTVQNWCGDVSKCPDYVRLMMARLLNII